MQWLESISASLRAAVALLGRVICTRTFLALLAIDCLFILIHLALAMGFWEPANPAFQNLRISRERGVPEHFEYAACAAGLAATALLILRTGDRAYWMVAALIFYLIVDNALGLHEYASDIIYTGALGEALFSLVFAIGFAIWAAVCLWRSTGYTRTVLTAVVVTVGYIAFFGIFVDGLHGLFVAPYTTLNGAMIVIEDGNELIGLTLLGALMLTVLGMTPRPSAARGHR